MQEYLSSGQQVADSASIKNIFAEHKDIFKQYTDLNVPKHILKKMIKELQEYHSQIVSYTESASVQPMS